MSNEEKRPQLNYDPSSYEDIKPSMILHEMPKHSLQNNIKNFDVKLSDVIIDKPKVDSFKFETTIESDPYSKYDSHYQDIYNIDNILSKQEQQSLQQKLSKSSLQSNLMKQKTKEETFIVSPMQTKGYDGR